MPADTACLGSAAGARQLAHTGSRGLFLLSTDSGSLGSAAGDRQLAHTGSVRVGGQDSASSLHKWPISHASSAGAEQLSAANRAARRE